MDDFSLGRLERVELRDIWATEAVDFTPWLAGDDNLRLLGDTLGIDLELEAQEKAVGPFRADILCKDLGSDNWVLIENQLERTDHLHLGQLLTYASGLEAVTIVWVAARFTEEHRSTLDWLNKITNETFRFFGLEVELWKIGDSPAAPKFNIVSKPNNWSRSVAKAAREIDDSALSDVRLLQVNYWTDLHSVLDQLSGPVSGARKPQAQSWMNYAIGRAGFSLAAAMKRWRSRVQVELYISCTEAKPFFYLLREQRESIEADLGYQLEWEELPDGQDSRIFVALDEVDPDEREHWPVQHEWLAKKLNELHSVFSKRVRDLKSGDWVDHEDR
ncbi:DUF4268 domain-containing protein [Aurantiacibacter sediminis]|uniref:DUF4268 domain-containing protein n=1 Tax=Aurantiacibacter sediminis TaxID=2793064 RepID=A0ABS0N368_9SPHN|nr:DUF4268 domain-containing protein [Aurantiacibacter sediminis]MBH5322404.1 DUF4268 domain-containing protein [Aurantiacibacter sediminis]